MKVAVISNPNARRNLLNPQRSADLERRVGDGLFLRTRGPEDCGPAVRRCMDAGVQLILTDGGDGTFHHVWNAAQLEAGPGAPPILPLNSGTLNIVARFAGERRRPEKILDDWRTRAGFDRFALAPALNIELDLTDGSCRRLVGIVALAAGVGVRALELYNADARPGPRAILRLLWAATRSLATGGGFLEDLMRTDALQARVNGAPAVSGAFHVAAAGAFPMSLAGLLRAFPDAGAAGFAFWLGRIQRREIPGLMFRLATGRALRGAQLSEQTVQSVELQSSGNPLRPYIDGELQPPCHAIRITTGAVLRLPV